MLRTPLPTHGAGPQNRQFDVVVADFFCVCYSCNCVECLSTNIYQSVAINSLGTGTGCVIVPPDEFRVVSGTCFGRPWVCKSRCFRVLFWFGKFPGPVLVRQAVSPRPTSSGSVVRVQGCFRELRQCCKTKILSWQKEHLGNCLVFGRFTLQPRFGSAGHGSEGVVCHSTVVTVEFAASLTSSGLFSGLASAGHGYAKVVPVEFAASPDSGLGVSGSCFGPAFVRQAMGKKR